MLVILPLSELGIESIVKTMPCAGSGSNLPLIHLLISELCISFTCLHYLLFHLSFSSLFPYLSTPLLIFSF